MPYPCIVAEALRTLPVAPPASRQPCSEVDRDTYDRVANAALAAARSDRTPPAILMQHQCDSWRRVMAAFDGWSGAIVAEPVGSGKTWIALAAALSTGASTVVAVPAILEQQWREASGRAGVPIALWSHERFSRGRLPPANPRLVIIDEAHRFRDPATRRYRTLAPWLVGRQVLLLTATPIVNRLDDLLSLLRLFTADDALAADGVRSLSASMQSGSPPRALARLVIRSTERSVGTVGAIETIRAAWDEEQRGTEAVAAIESLGLSRSRAIRRLVRSVLLDAASSSDAALCAAIRRYRALLLQQRDASGGTRAALRRFAGPEFAQTVLWELCDAGATTELDNSDLIRIDALIGAATHDDAWCAALLSVMADDVCTVCFARHRATANLLRRALGERTAWVSGADAGIGPHRLPRGAVLSAFGPAREQWRVFRQPPTILVTTDVAAEGLDLQGAGRMIHVDLPWTATRMAQRQGRLLRLGQREANVPIIVRTPPLAIERALGQRRAIDRKATLATTWLDKLQRDGATQPVSGIAAPCIATAVGVESTDVVVVAVTSGQRSGAVVVVRSESGGWLISETPAIAIARPTERSADCRYSIDDAGRIIDSALAAIASHIAPAAAHGHSALILRIQRLARAAARRRDRVALRQLDCLLRFTASSHTAGERMLIDQLFDASDETLLRASVPNVTRTATELRPVAVLKVRTVDRPLSLSSCQRSVHKSTAAARCASGDTRSTDRDDGSCDS